MNKSVISETDRKNVSPEKTKEYTAKLKKMIDCKTVFTRDFANKDSFDKFYSVVEECFPLLCAKAERLTFGSGCFVYVVKGKNAKKNIMLMSHHDVVDGDDNWNSDPFCAVEKDGSLWGRGTIDTKTPLFAELQACEELLAEGYDFDGINLYIGSSNNEEVCGDGMVLATEYFKNNGIHFDAVLDEGGAITTGMIPGVSRKSAMVAVHEKSRHMYRCTATQAAKAHGGLNPSDDSAIERMSNFISEVCKARIFKGHFYPEVRATFETHAPHMSFPLNFLFGHLTVFSPLIKKIMLSMPQAKAMLSTSISFTTVFAGSQDDPQIKAKEAVSTMFLRCIREEDLLNGLEKIKKIAEKYGVKIEQTERDYCKPSSFTSRPFKVLEQVMNENFPDVIVAPFLLTAGTDARRFTDVADSILRFAPIDLDKDQFASIHSANEHIKVDNIGQCVCFYKDFLKKI
ncbi:MAG: M20/M25/M40 family metallo-hydrolase [Clostridia bacterium]|nr:M20/M25/M40 family metallo-hydrolase [Clostridia bacterium]